MTSAPSRIRMLVELAALPAPTLLPSGLPAPRAPEPDDSTTLARLALTAFSGTVDDDWSLSDYADDIEATLGGRFGPFLADASALVGTPTQAIGAVLLTYEYELPFMPYCLTDPATQRRGLATHLILRAARVLLRDGHQQLHLAVVETNPATALYTRLGFRQVPLP